MRSQEVGRAAVKLRFANVIVCECPRLASQSAVCVLVPRRPAMVIRYFSRRREGGSKLPRRPLHCLALGSCMQHVTKNKHIKHPTNSIDIIYGSELMAYLILYL